MSRVQNSGFYKLQFLMTPEQVQRASELLAAQQARFHQTNYGQQQDEVEQVLAALSEGWLWQQYELVAKN